MADPGAGSVGRSSAASIWILGQDRGRHKPETITMPIVANRNRDIRGRTIVLEDITRTAGLVNGGVYDVQL